MPSRASSVARCNQILGRFLRLRRPGNQCINQRSDARI